MFKHCGLIAVFGVLAACSREEPNPPRPRLRRLRRQRARSPHPPRPLPRSRASPRRPAQRPISSSRPTERWFAVPYASCSG